MTGDYVLEITGFTPTGLPTRTGNFTVSYYHSCDTTGPGVARVRYRLYSDVTLEHLFTTDINEYVTLPHHGWIQEGPTGLLYTNAVTRNGVAAVPYYRLYNHSIFQHHWTTDLNEYNTLATRGWAQEGISGWIFPSPTCGSIPLYRLSFPFPAVHHWTTDGFEYNYLGSQGWTQEGIAGYLVN